MEVQLTDDQRAFVRQAIESGRYKQEEDVLRDALSMWEERERRRMEILAAIGIADAQFARGEGRWINSLEESRQLADEIKERGMARLAAQANNR